MNTVTLPAGRYLIGDLCYRGNQIWDSMIDHIDGKAHKLPSDRFYVILKTKWGDGSYFDFDRNEYWVDSGTIGIMEWDGDDMSGPNGRTFDFMTEFAVFEDKGDLHFGAVVVETDPQYDEQVDYEETDNALEEEF